MRVHPKKHMNNTAIIIMSIVIFGGGSFYAGMKYDQSKNPVAAGNTGRFAALSPEERQARSQQFGGMMGMGGRGMRAGQGGFSAGEILSKDDKSITIKLRDGGSKIIFLSDTTKVMKAVDGSSKDLAVGEQVIAAGKTNADGSVTAESVQVRPPLPANQ